MKYAIGMLCFFASLVLAACSEDADKVLNTIRVCF